MKLRCVECGRPCDPPPNNNHHPWEPFNFADLIRRKDWHAKFVLWRWKLLRPVIRKGWL